MSPIALVATGRPVRPGRLRSRSGDWPAATGRRGIPCREARRADLTGMKGRSTMVVKLITQSC
jgi:hypothetical protein